MPAKKQQPTISKFFGGGAKPTPAVAKPSTEASPTRDLEVETPPKGTKRPAASNEDEPNSKFQKFMRSPVKTPAKAPVEVGNGAGVSEPTPVKSPAPPVKSTPTPGKSSESTPVSARKQAPAKKPEPLSPPTPQIINNTVASDAELSFIRGEAKGDIVTTALKVRDKFTPLEEQFVAIKKRFPDSVLFVECGYKFKFFGRDAEVAAKHLKIMLIQKDGEPFVTASVPTQRLYFHVDRLTGLGYKVGIVKQTESAAFRETTSTKLFTRDLSNLYTRATFIPENDDMRQDGDRGSARSGMYKAEENRIVIVCEEPSEGSVSLEDNAPNVTVTVLAVSLSTGGAIVWDVFEDGPLRRELETRLYQLDPVEILCPKDMTPLTSNLLFSLGVNTWGQSDTKECYGNIHYETRPLNSFCGKAQLSKVTTFFSPDTKDGAPSKDTHTKELSQLPASVIGSLGALIEYLKPFKLEHLLKCASSATGTASHEVHHFEQFSSTDHMSLPSSTLANMEVFQSTSALAAGFLGQTTYQGKGSLYWLLNHTRTPFGARLLHKWLCQPLLKIDAITERQDAVQELLEGPCADAFLSLRKQILDGTPDLERVLTKIHYAKASPNEFLKFLKAFQKISNTLQAFVGTPSEEGATDDGDDKAHPLMPTNGQLGGMTSKLLVRTLLGVPVADMSACITKFITSFHHPAAMSNTKSELFIKSNRFPSISEITEKAESVKSQLDQHLREIREKLKNPKLQYHSVSGQDYLIEVPVKDASKVPREWIVISRLKAVHRFHTPFIQDCCKQLAQCKERLSIESDKCWVQILEDFSAQNYALFRSATNKIAILDCLFSLAEVARLPGYCRPQITGEREVCLEDARHPMIERLLQERSGTKINSAESSGDGSTTYVPNHVNLSDKGLKTMIITGPNMGGKSSYIRQVALIVLMAQVGSYVPAASARLGVFDGIYARMGARDNISQGQSTFMVELQETADIIRRATDRSLVILDELGRGTSTHDGVAIAHATLEHIITTIKCTCLFVTHYHILTKIAKQHEKVVDSHYMAFFEEKPEPAENDMAQDEDGNIPIPKITFLYKLKRGASPSSFGLNIARLAGIEPKVLKEAAIKADEMHTKGQVQHMKREELDLQSLKELYGALTQVVAQIEASESASESIQKMATLMEC